MYQVNASGQIRSVDRTVECRGGYQKHLKGREIRPQHYQNGYLFVALCKDGEHRQMTVHRIVAETFVSNPLGLPEVNHIDGDKNNNASTNLQWCTRQDNCLHAVRSGLKSMAPVHAAANKANMRPVVREDGVVYCSIKEASRKNGISRGVISQSLHRGCRAGGFHWRYLDEQKQSSKTSEISTGSTTRNTKRGSASEYQLSGTN